MGGVGAIVGVFLLFSLAISWVSGDKEKTRLEDAIKEKSTVEQKLETDLSSAKSKLTKEAEAFKDLEGQLKAELNEKKKLERALAFEERQRRIAEKEGMTVDLEKEREKMRAEIESKTLQEISDLESKLVAVQEAKARSEAEMKLKIEEEARKRAEEAWTQAELARSKAEEVLTFKREA